MSPRPKFACDGNHADLTDRELNNHNNHYCKDELTTAGRRRYIASRRAAAKASAEEQDGTASSAAPDTVGEVGDATAAHDAPEVAQRPTSPTAPKPAPPAVTSTISSRGAARRLRALITFGYTPRMLHKVTGLSEDSVWWLLAAPPESIQARTHRAVVDAFKLLRVTPLVGPDADRSRALADLNDWAGPYDWDDIDTDHKPPHHTARKSWDSTALAEAINAAKLEQGEPDAYSTDTVLEARAEAGRLRVELEHTNASYEQLRSTAASAIGEVDGLRERLQRRDGEILALRDQLTAANDHADGLRHLLDEANAGRAVLAEEADVAAQRIAELELAGSSDSAVVEPTAPVSYIGQWPRAVDPDAYEAACAAFQAAPALAAEVAITIERTERGVSIVFPASLLAEGGR